MPNAGLFGILDSLTGTDVIVVLIVALIVLGPDKLPEISRSMGKWVAKARRIAANLQSEMNDVLADPSMKPIKEIGEFVAQPRRKLTEFALAAEVEANEEANAAAQADANVAAIAEANALVEPAEVIETIELAEKAEPAEPAEPAETEVPDATAHPIT